MAETADKIRAGIERKRAELDEKLARIETRAREGLSVRRRVARHPWKALGAAAGTGLVLGLIFGGRPERRARDYFHRHGRRSTDGLATGVTGQLVARANNTRAKSRDAATRVSAEPVVPGRIYGREPVATPDYASQPVVARKPMVTRERGER